MKTLFAWLALSLGMALSLPVRAGADLVLAVSEGTSGGLDHAQVIAKYKGLADVLGRALKTTVNVVFAREFSALEEGLKTSQFAFVIARPSDYPARGMRDYGYSYVATAKPDGQCFIIVPKDSPLKKLDDIRGKKIVMPEKVAYMSRFCAAELRDKGINLAQEKVQYVREQAAVAFYLEHKFAEVGAIASYSGVAKKWQIDGNRILHKSLAQPYFPLVASSKIRPEQIEAVQKELLSLSGTESGQKLLKRIGIEEFDTSSEGRMRDLLKWMGM